MPRRPLGLRRLERGATTRAVFAHGGNGFRKAGRLELFSLRAPAASSSHRRPAVEEQDEQDCASRVLASPAATSTRRPPDRWYKVARAAGRRPERAIGPRRASTPIAPIRASLLVRESHAPPALTGQDRTGHLRPQREKCSPGPVDHPRYLIYGLRLRLRRARTIYVKSAAV